MWFLPTIFAFGCIIAVHALLRRLAPAGNSVLHFLGVAGLGIGLLFGWLVATGSPSIAVVAALSLLVFICELYLFLFTFAISSVSIALLLEATGLTRPTEAEVQSPAIRVERMLESGLLIKTASGYVLTTAGRIIVMLRSLLRSFFRHEP